MTGMTQREKEQAKIITQLVLDMEVYASAMKVVIKKANTERDEVLNELKNGYFYNSLNPADKAHVESCLFNSLRLIFPYSLGRVYSSFRAYGDIIFEHR